MSFIPGQQLGDNADISLTNIDGDEGASKGNLLVGKNTDDKAEFATIDGGLLSTYDMSLAVLIQELIREVRKTNKYLELMSDEELVDGDFK